MLLKILVMGVQRCNRSRLSDSYDRIFLTSLLVIKEYKFLVKSIRFKAIIWCYLFMCRFSSEKTIFFQGFFIDVANAR